MNYITNYSEVSFFLINDSQLLLIKEDHELEVPDLNVSKLLNNPNKLYFFGGKIIVLDEQKFLFFDGANFIDSGFSGIGLYPLENEKVLIFQRNKDQDKMIKLYNNNDLIWSHQFNNMTRHITSSYIVYSPGFDDHELIMKDLDLFETLWNLDVSSLGRYTDHEGEHLGKVTGKVLLAEDVLVVPVTGYKLLGVDIETGKVKWQIPSEGRMKCVNYKNEIWLLNDKFRKINYATGEEEVAHPFMEPLLESGARSEVSITVTDQYIITCGSLDCVVTQWSKETGNILDKQRIYADSETGRRGISITETAYSEGKYYVKDSNNTLHVFALDANAKR